MKKPYFVMYYCFLALFFISTNIFADNPKVKGYYVNKSGDTIKALIQVHTKLLNDNPENGPQVNFTYFDKKGQKVKMDAHDANAYGYMYQGERFAFRLLYENADKAEVTFMGIKMRAQFYKVLIDGPCKMYYTIVQKSSGNAQISSQEFIIFKDERNYCTTNPSLIYGSMAVTSVNGSSNLEEFFSDCPELVTKIKNKEYRKGDDRFYRLVNFYNANCQANENQKVEE